MPLAAHEDHQAHSRSPIMVDTGGEVRSPICRTTERGAWGEGTKDEALY